MNPQQSSDAGATEANQHLINSAQPDRPTPAGASQAPVIDPKESNVIVSVIDRKRVVTRRTIAWVFCGIIFALIPVYVDLAKQMSPGGVVDWLMVLRKGENYVVGFVVALGAVGEILAATFEEEDKNSALLFGLGSIAAALANFIAYIIAPTSGITFLGWSSVVLGVGTVLVCTVCVRMAAGR